GLILYLPSSLYTLPLHDALPISSRVRPDLADRFCWPSNEALRSEIAEVVPLYRGIETLRATGDSVQYGGRHLPIERGRFSVVRRSEEHTSELQSRVDLVCRLLLE